MSVRSMTRMLAAMILPCVVVAVDLAAARVRALRRLDQRLAALALPGSRQGSPLACAEQKEQGYCSVRRAGVNGYLYSRSVRRCGHGAGQQRQQ